MCSAQHLTFLLCARSDGTAVIQRTKVLLCFLRHSEERLRHERQHFVSLGWVLSTHLVSQESNSTGRQRTDPSSLPEPDPVSLACISTIPTCVKYSAIQTRVTRQKDNHPVSIRRKGRWGRVPSPLPTSSLGSTACRFESIQRANPLSSKSSFWVRSATKEGKSKLIHGWALKCTEEDHSDHLGSVPLNGQISTVRGGLST